MKIKALKSFVGVLDMAVGEVAELSDERLAAALIACGYAEEITEESSIENKRNNGRRRKAGTEN